MSTEKVVKAYGELGGDLHLMSIERGSNGLGLSLAGDKDLNIMSVLIAGIKPTGIVAQDGRIHVGDQILEVSEWVGGRNWCDTGHLLQGVVICFTRLNALLSSKRLSLTTINGQQNQQALSMRPSHPHFDRFPTPTVKYNPWVARV